MKICIIAEGSYPYVTGGVSSWIQMLIKNMNEHEFVIYAIGAEEKNKGNFKYEIPDNVIKVEEIFLDSFLKYKTRYKKKYKIKEEVKKDLKAFVTGDEICWDNIFSFMREAKTNNVMELFMSWDFFDIIEEAYIEKYDLIPFTEYFWMVRSMLLPIFLVLKSPIPEADIYHSVSTGYAGIAGSLAKHIYNKPFILTEHGIYTREREEEIIKSQWVKGYFKNMWIDFFYNMSKCAYDNSDKVITLFNKNKEMEIELGCSKDKIDIIPNGVDMNNFKDVPCKDENDNNINIGAVIRVVPIKDIKTMIYSFNLVKQEMKNAKFYIMGPTDENEEYYEECKSIVKEIGAEDIIFTGKVNIKEYVGKMDILVLSSISEGQPLAILEGMCFKKPFVATDVGSCKELLYGLNDNYGQAGFIVPVMNYEKMAKEIIRLCRDEKLRKEMGKNAFNRVSNLYTIENFINGYKEIYNGYRK
ncbi:GT4 family glycosyltransferase PelF [Clostridium aestuarii]|uniref:GT4 family glycosyltransferase PelF n=1 Tax=Clostridium aestuarii TaxID=338193 RepID=A0ABT4CVB0_9CLOT|nr:GT4 family glycosyltransferase PelF [Clostridium aestuarii]